MTPPSQPGEVSGGGPAAGRPARGVDRLRRGLGRIMGHGGHSGGEAGVLASDGPARGTHRGLGGKLGPKLGGRLGGKLGHKLGWSSLIEGAPYGVFRSTAGFPGFLEANPALVRMLGYGSKAELLAADLARDVYLNPAARRAAIGAVLAGPEASFQTEVRWRRKDGTALDVVLHGRRLRQLGSAGVMFEVMAEDVTERRQAERETVAARKLQSDFVSFVSHQLRTPLTGIRWMIELAQQTPGLPEEIASCLADARQSAERLVALIADLLNVAHCEAGKTRWVAAEVDLAALTASLIHELRPQIELKEHRIAFHPGPDLPSVPADGRLLRQVMLNLLSNAIKYTPLGGDVEVRAGRQGNEVIWSVRDNGIGVPKEAQSRLFEKFYRADNACELETEGTGLGLYWVRRIMEQAGGRVWWESAGEPAEGSRDAAATRRQSQGSVFSFALPWNQGGKGAPA